MGAGRLRWWSSGESRSDLNSRLHEQWQKEQGEKGFFPQSERWPTIRSDDLSFHPFLAEHGKFELPPELKPRRIGYSKSGAQMVREMEERLWYGNTRVVSCPHVPENTAYIFQGEWKCSLCEKEKTMDAAPGSIVEREELLRDRALLNELTWMLSKEVDGQKDTGAVDTLNRLLSERRELIEEKMKNRGGHWVGHRFVDAMCRLMDKEEKGAFSDGQFEERVTELLEMESMVNGSSVLVQDRPLSPEELRDLTGVNSVVRCGLRATDDSHDSETAQRLAAIINNTPPQTVAGRVDLADYLLKEKHIGMAECPSVLETGRLPEEKEAVTITSPTGEKLTMHFPKERDMATSSKMTIEEYRKEYGEPKHVGEDVFCKCCGQKAARTFGPAPYEYRMGLRPNIEGWMKVFFPIRTTFEGVMHESFDVCTSCAKKVSDYIAYVGKEKSGETGLSDVDLLADDA